MGGNIPRGKTVLKTDVKTVLKTVLLRIGVTSIFIFAIVVNTNAESIPEVRSETTIEWLEASFFIEAFVDTSTIDKPIPGVRASAEDAVKRALLDIIRDALFDIPYDSFENLGDRAMRDTSILTKIEALSRNPVRIYGYLTEDLSEYIAKYRFDFYPDIVTIFLLHQRAFKPEPLLSFEASTQFSGIIIYAKDPLPVHGETIPEDEEDDYELLVPSLFPKIYSESMDIFFEVDMVDPEAVATWGMIQYTTDLDLASHRERIGDQPLVTTARKIFGKNRTDLLIPDLSARRILALEDNIQLLMEGRVVIICNLP